MPAGFLSSRPLGTSELEVSALSLGSWRTFERLPPETGVAIMRAAREEGINFFDDARYDDEVGTAPIRTGYSEVLFGELFRGAGLRRDEVVVANKLWWEFWPTQSAAAELDASLRRMGFDHVDVIYANAPPRGMAVAGLGVAPPCAVQLPYSLVSRSWVEDAAMTRALDAAGAGVIASFCLAGGVLTGKYQSGPAAGRAAGTLTDPRAAPAVAAAEELAGLAGRLDSTAAALAIAFPLTNPAVTSVLFGATSAEQVRANCAAISLLNRLGPADLAHLQRIGRPGALGSG
jgi:L-glyceraldehyde 3-phosphate reductase